MTKIMAVNAGSSSLKFQLFDMPKETVITSGIVERIGLKDGIFTIKYNGEKKTTTQDIPNHEVAVQLLLEALIKENILNNLDEIEAVGHRVVHGGEYFTDSVAVEAEVIDKVEELCELAPLHNPANLIGYRAFKEALKDAGHVFTFDTAFHQTIAQDNYLYALPMSFYEDLKVRKYGAHGTSHKYVSEQATKMLEKEDSKVIVCHLGNGASLSAVRGGRCVDTSMGFTPLAGVMMGTRCGDVDPSIMPYLCEKLDKSPQEVLDIYNKESGMLGVSGISSDSRDIENAYYEGNDAAIRTSLLYSNIVSKYISSYYGELGGCDAIVFTAGVGENAAYLRSIIIKNLTEAYGVSLDEDKNAVRSSDARVISDAKSKIQVMVIPTDEEVMIARDTVRILGL